MRKIILTSFGFANKVSRELIANALKGENLATKKIFLFHEPYYFIGEKLRQGCVSIGFSEENVILSGEQKCNEQILEMDYIYINEGNTFSIIKALREKGLDVIYRKAFFDRGVTYIGASAGAMIAGESIEGAACCGDKNYENVTDCSGLCLYDGIILPHYTRHEAKRYIKNSLGIAERYSNIYSVSNEGILVLEV